MKYLSRSIALVLSLTFVASLSAAKPVFESDVISASTPGNSVDIKANIAGAKKLYLVVNDAGDGFSCDWAGWGNPVLVGKSSRKKLTELKWTSAASGYGSVQVNGNCRNQSMRCNGALIEEGIGTHANSIIEYELPTGYNEFHATGFLDDGGTTQGCGSTVKFLVLTEKPDAKYLTSATSIDITERTPENALDGLSVNDDLNVQLFAAEPMMFSPSNIDIDHKGRVWVCEVVNYRKFRNKSPERTEGDRILILEDTDGDGAADKESTFYQGRDIDSAHGVCVLGNKAIVSAGDSIIVLTDEDGDDKADKKEVLFSGIAGTQHDHGIHSVLFGPDGKLYFNFGNNGKHLYDKDGNPIVDKMGNIVKDDRQPYQEGMAFRCNLDGSEVETLGWNFRNNWELAVDSFGNIWQSDNDDDGNRGVRINFVIEYGNYGYKDELTGAGWRDFRTGMSEEIPERHWHLKDPGVVPNLLQTGAGSPTGILVYEGDLLPERFLGELVHCDAGPNVVRAYHVEKAGAGYSAEIEDILVGETDKWFRPSDVCVAPDGSLIIADWYDPGVGGHAQGDVERGRLFRVAPKSAAEYKSPEFDFESVEGAITALQNPNLAVRYLAWTSLKDKGEKAEPALRKLWTSDAPDHLRARALWLLGELPGRWSQYIGEAFDDENDQIRIAGLRLSRRLGVETTDTVSLLLDDPSPQVRRECAIALAESKSGKVPQLWTELAERADVHDRWMLEALGIAARGRWDECLDAFLPGKDLMSDQVSLIVWRSRGTKTPELIAKIIASQETPEMYLPYLFRSMDFQPNLELRDQVLTELAFGELERTQQVSFIRGEALNRIGSLDFGKNPEYKNALDQILDDQQGTLQFITLVDKFNLEERYPQLLKLAQDKPATQEGVAAASLLISKRQWPMLRKAVLAEDRKAAAATLEALGNTGSGGLTGLLMPIVTDPDRDSELRRQSIRALAKTRNGAQALVAMAQQKKLDETLTPAVAAGLHTAQWRDIKEQAARLFPQPPSKNNKPLPPITELVKLNGDPTRGKLLFNTTGTCAKCHVVNDIGKEVGPNLSEIGSKLSPQAMYESILFPSAGVAHNYETYMIVTEDGTTISGVMVSDTPDSVTLKGADAIPKTVSKGKIEELVKQKISLMPADVQKLLTEQELVDIVKYLLTLKKK